MSSRNQIQNLAYILYLIRGKKEGGALSDWRMAEKIIAWGNALLDFVKHPLILIIASGLFIWSIQQSYLLSQEKLRMRFETMKMVLPIYTNYYQEIWNEWYAFLNKQPSIEYRRNIQRTVAEAKSIEAQIPILFNDKKIYEDWKKILHYFWEAHYLISREGLTEQQLNDKLNLINPVIGDILNRMYREINK